MSASARLSCGWHFKNAGIAEHSLSHRSFSVQPQMSVFIHLLAVWWGKAAGARGWLLVSRLVCDSCVLYFYFCRAVLMECVAMGTVTSQAAKGPGGAELLGSTVPRWALLWSPGALPQRVTPWFLLCSGEQMAEPEMGGGWFCLP